MSVLAIIPARGGSKEIPNKNMIKVKGKKLIEFTLIEANKSKVIDKICVSSDSKKILNLSKKFNVETIKRPKSLSGSKSKTFDTVKHTLKYYKKKNYIPKYVIILQPTSIFRKKKHIDEALKKLLDDKKADSLVSCYEVPHNLVPEKLMKIIKRKYLDFKKNIILRQFIKKYYARNGAIYIFNNLKKKNIFGNKVIPYFMDKKSSFDIDDFEDLEIVKKLIR